MPAGWRSSISAAQRPHFMPRRSKGSIFTCFVAKHVKMLPLLLRGIKWGRCAAEIDERQPAGIAVRQNPHSVSDELAAFFPNITAMFDILVGEFLRRGSRQRLLFGH